ncbi:MAG: hypothetical protein WBD02_03160 [Acidimicrobiia bacterium]
MRNEQQLSLDIEGALPPAAKVEPAPWQVEDRDRLAGRRGLAAARAILARGRVAA